MVYLFNHQLDTDQSNNDEVKQDQLETQPEIAPTQWTRRSTLKIDVRAKAETDSGSTTTEQPTTTEGRVVKMAYPGYAKIFKN